MSAYQFPSRGRVEQRGVVLIIALIMLAAMMLAGIALYRKIGSGTILAGNLTFTEAAINAAEQGSETARNWLRLQTAGNLGVAQAGYFPASCYTQSTQAISNIDCTDVGAPTFDPLQVGDAWWTTNGVLVTADDGAGNEVRYVVHRLCNQAGSVSGNNGTKAQQCVLTTDVSTVQHSDTRTVEAVIYPLFRITTRSRGPRNTTAYTQVTMF